MNIHACDISNIPQEVWDIYESSFPANERKTKESIIENINSGKEFLFVATENTAVVGFALMFDLKNTNYVLLDYLAVQADIKQKGVGTAILQFIRKSFLKSPQSLVIETDKPIKSQTEETYDQNLKRVLFYLKNGAKIIDAFDYILPSLNFSTKTTQWLMILENSSRERIDKVELEKILTNLYTQNYTDFYDREDLYRMIDQLKTHHDLISKIENY